MSLYDEMDYCNIDDIKNIENLIIELTTEIQKLNIPIPTYNRVIFSDDFFYVEDVEIIENGIEKLGHYFYKPNNWIKTRKYSNSKKEIFSYKDMNRWINNLKLIQKALLDENITLWNVNSTTNWNTTSNIEWEE